ncbi:hypothetical protein L1987_63179 [Smallanthus sonchifolius]|uniref:Uncharacterized protein n=1 Tax=Smallanthus sonchifolius TaxID=185202 RepID=A0ACB9CCH7_9ASTR|nr:hypothetical protein L1987_63179 [Smallanthus sonchifolius]
MRYVSLSLSLSHTKNKLKSEAVEQVTINHNKKVKKILEYFHLSLRRILSQDFLVGICFITLLPISLPPHVNTPPFRSRSIPAGEQVINVPLHRNSEKKNDSIWTPYVLNKPCESDCFIRKPLISGQR